MKQANSDAVGISRKRLTLCIDTTQFDLDGKWEWELQCDAVFCSDVMDFPGDFQGTVGIFHPDDLPGVKGTLQLLRDSELQQLSFRMITTYGDVKVISGQQVNMEQPKGDEEEAEPLESDLEKVLRELAEWEEGSHLRLRRDMAVLSERLYNTGTWYVNKSLNESWYSDQVYRIHGLQPQSLNAHGNTFSPFIHPEDRVVVTDAFEKAYAEELPLHITYRVVTPAGETKRVQQFTEWSFTTSGQHIFYGIIRDITGDQETEDQMASADAMSQLHQQILKFTELQAATGYFVINLVTHKTIFSDNYNRIFGIKQPLVPSFNVLLKLVHPEDRDYIQRVYDKMIREHVVEDVEFRILRADGKQRSLRQSGKLYVFGQNELLIIGVVQDLTLKKGFETKIHDLNQRLQLQEMINELTEGIAEVSSVVWLPEGHMHWSNGFYKMLGYRPGSPEPHERLLYKSIHHSDIQLFKHAVSLVLNGQAHEDLVIRLVSKAGIRYVKLSFRQVGDVERKFVIGIFQDITGQQKLEQELAGQTRFADLLNNTLDNMVLLTDADHTIINWNEAATDLTGIDRKDALQKNLFDVFPSLKEERYFNLLQQVNSGAVVTQTGSRKYYLNKPHNYTLSPLKGQHDEVLGILHMVQDTTKEQDLEQRLNERLNFIENLVESSVDRIVVLDRNMNYLYWNQKAEDFYAINKERVLGKNILEIFPAFRNDPSYGEFRKVLRGETVHIPAQMEDDEDSYFETYLTPIKDGEGAVTAVLWIVHDLKNEFRLQQVQRMAQNQLKEEHRRLNEAQVIGHVGSFTWEVGSNVSHWSDELYRINGLAPQSEEITLDKVDQFIHQDDFAELQRLKEASFQTAGEYKIVHRIVHRSGEVRWVNHQWESIADERGNIVRVSGIVQDITEKKKAEEEVVLHQQLLQATMDSSADMIQVFEAVRNEEGVIVDFRYLLLNHEAEKWMPDVIGKSLLQQQPGVVEEGIFERFKQVVESGVSQQYEMHYVHEQFDGWFHQSVVKLDDGVATTTTNITERKKAEQEVLRLKDEVAQKVTDKYQRLFNSIDEGFCIIEMLYNKKGEPVDWFFHEVNDSFIKQNGADMTGKRFSEFVPSMQEFDYWLRFYDNVLKTGKAARSENYVPVYDEWRNIYASLLNENKNLLAVVFNDITAHKLNEQRQAFLLKLNDALRTLTDLKKIQGTATQIAIDYFKSARCYYCELQDNVAVIRQDAAREGVPSMAGSYDLRDYPLLTSMLGKGAPLVVPHVADLTITDESLKEFCRQANIAAYINTPVLKNGEAVGLFCVIEDKERAWTKMEVEIAEELAQRIWIAVERGKAEEALRESEERFRTYVIASFETVYKMSADWKIMYHLHGKGFLADTTTTTSWLDQYIPGDEREKVWQAIEEAIQQKKIFTLEHQVIDASGKRAWTYSRAVPRLDEQGEIIEWIGAATNITEQKEAEEQLKGFAQLLEHQVEERTYALKKSTEELQKNLAILQNTEELAQMGSWEYELVTGNFTWSDGMYQLFGIPVGTRVQPEIYLDAALADDRPVVKHMLKCLKKNHQPFEELIRIKRGDETRLLKVKASVMQNEIGEPSKLVGVDVDVTDVKRAQEKLQESQHWLQQTAVTSPDSITIYDLRKKQPVYLNNCLANWLGTTPEDLVEMGIDGRLTLIYPDDRLKLLHFNELTAMARDEEILRLEYRVRSKGGKLLWLRNRSKVFQRDKEGRATHILSILEDITAEKEAENKLLELNTSLEQKNRTLENKNEEITSFAFIASHDLKEPLRKMHTFSDWLIEQERENLSEKGKRYLEKMTATVKRMDLLIEDILVLAKVNSDKNRLEAIDLKSVLENVKKEVLRHGATITYPETLPALQGNKNQIFYLFHNLLENAIKFQAPGNVPHIAIASNVIKGSQVEHHDVIADKLYLQLSIKDNGLGFDDRYTSKIFQVFQRLHQEKEFEGTGIGLAICRKIMENHHGFITAESKKGEGATFYCYFPIVS